MKVYDIIDNRETPAKKYTISYNGDARDVARLFASGDLRLHLPDDDGEGGAVCRWFYCHDAALTVKPARVIEDFDALRSLYEQAKRDERRAWYLFKLSYKTDEAPKAWENLERARYFLEGITAAVEAVGRFDLFRGGRG